MPYPRACLMPVQLMPVPPMPVQPMPSSRSPCSRSSCQPTPCSLAPCSHPHHRLNTHLAPSPRSQVLTQSVTKKPFQNVWIALCYTFNNLLYFDALSALSAVAYQAAAA